MFLFVLQKRLFGFCSSDLEKMSLFFFLLHLTCSVQGKFLHFMRTLGLLLLLQASHLPCGDTVDVVDVSLQEYLQVKRLQLFTKQKKTTTSPSAGTA